MRFLRYVKSVYLILLISFSFSINPFAAMAETYEWVQMGKDDIRVTTDVKVEAALRLDLIESAETSIDLVTFDQRMDTEIGLPILEKLGSAAARGVNIRYAISSSMTPVTDTFNSVGRYLEKITAEHPNLEYLFAGGAAMMWKSGWGPLDGIHEKLLIIDHKIAFVTGRGHADAYSTWLDTAFIFKGELVQQSNLAFDRLWITLNRELKRDLKENLAPQAPNSTPTLPTELPQADNTANTPTSDQGIPAQIQLDEIEQSELSSLIEWSKLPPSGQQDYRARLLHHDFLDQIRATGRKPSSISTAERLEFLTDPIVEEVKRLLPDSTSMRYCSLATILNPQIKQAMLTALTRPDPIQLEVFTNSKLGQTNLSAVHMAVGWYAGIQDLDDLLLTGNAKGYHLNDSTENSPTPSFAWLHRKLILIAGGEKSTVIFGSHNLTLASTVALDEISFEIESSDFYQKMVELVDSSLASFGTEILPEELHLDRTSHSFQERLASNFSLMFKPK